MEGFPPFASLSFLDVLPPGAAVFDLVYHPRQTALLAAAQDRGLTAIGGMELLVQQAILPFPALPARPWTGRPSAGTCWRWWERNKKYTPQSTRDCGVFACV